MTTPTAPNSLPRNLWALLLPLGLSAWALPPAASAESLDDLRGIVRVEHTRSFSDVENLAFTVKTAPPVAVVLPKGKSPSDLIASVYGFGGSDSPEAYQLMQRRILALNGATDTTTLKAGKILVPDLPILTSKSASGMESEAPLVKNASGKVDYKVVATGDLRSAYSKPITIANQLSKSLTYSRLDNFSAHEAARIIAEARKENRDVDGGTEAGIELGASPAGCADPSVEVLSPEERTEVAAAIGGTQDQTERYLFILDTGWPTVEDQARALQHLRRIFDAVRSAIQLPTTAAPRFPSAISPSTFLPLNHVHACMISRSLREFIALDNAERIKVIYLPLRPGQVAANDLFREIISLDSLIAALGQEVFQRAPSDKEIVVAKEFSQLALGTLKAFKEPWQAGDDVVRIYEPLIRGLLSVLNTYARISPVTSPGASKVDARFWLSLSWNFTKFAAPPSLPTTKNYMVFAAAGNDRQDFILGDRLFASEAASGTRVFAVMNSDEKQGTLTCNSALFQKLWDEPNVSSNIGAFPGRLALDATYPCPGPGGGTSFSTPRLAWLTAASDVASRAEDGNWPKALSLRLVKGREKVAGYPTAAPIRVKKLFAIQQESHQ